MAESADDFDEARAWLDKAEFCFRQIGDHELGRKVRGHIQSIQFCSDIAAATEQINTYEVEARAAKTV